MFLGEVESVSPRTGTPHTIHIVTAAQLNFCARVSRRLAPSRYFVLPELLLDPFRKSVAAPSIACW